MECPNLITQYENESKREQEGKSNKIEKKITKKRWSLNDETEYNKSIDEENCKKAEKKKRFSLPIKMSNIRNISIGVREKTSKVGHLFLFVKIRTIQRNYFVYRKIYQLDSIGD